MKLLGTLILTLNLTVYSQNHPNIDPSPQIIGKIDKLQNIPLNGNGNPTPSKAKKKTPKQLRQQAIQSLKIDRTPSGILKTRMKLQNNPKANQPVPELDLEQITKLDPEKQDQAKLTHFKKNITLIQTDVTLGNWARLKTTLASLPKGDASQIYSSILRSLNQEITVRPSPSTTSRPTSSTPSNKQTQYFPPSELLPLTEASPSPLNENHLKQLASLIGPKNRPTSSFYENLKGKHTHLGPSTPLTSKNTAILFINASLLLHATPYLPDQKKAIQENDFESLDLLARYHLDSHRQITGNKHLQKTWDISQIISSNKSAPSRYRTTALYRALELIPELDEKKSAQWLKETFSGKESAGYEILSTIAIVSSQIRSMPQFENRLQNIKLQHAAAGALLKNPSTNLSEWSEILTFFIINWNHEAQYSFQNDTSTTLGPIAQTDNYGNVYYTRQRRNAPQLRIQPIPSGALLTLTPSKAWLNHTQLNIQLEYLTLASKLYLKVKEEQKAFPLLKKIIQNRPNQAEHLIRELIKVWAENNNPNTQDNRYRSRYSYMRGYNRKAESIPLTRSKQERNLKNLSILINEIRSLKLSSSFDSEFADAFVAAHSTAEVWRLDTLQTVFGPIEQLEPEIIASLVDKMRFNLIALWPKFKVQQDAKTNRTDKELQAQILKGYDLAQTLLKQAIQNHPNNWKLNLQQAALTHERSNYQTSIGSNSQHSAKKAQALALFEKAAQQYISNLPLENKADETIDPFVIWFSAALGAPEISSLKNNQQPTPSEYPKIKETLKSIPDPVIAKRHQDLFAKIINARLANVAPDLKLRYLYAALPIIGEHPLATDALAIAEYYRDLITEIELDTHLAGSTNIAADKPFGLHINLHHTHEIERESGGFQRYLINQNSSANFNYGRPTEDYRDKFEDSLRSTLSENFDIISLTFHKPTVSSQTSKRQGWTITPYAYALLKPKGPHIDTIPPLKIDLDFLDTSGHVIIPITSPAIPISTDSSDTTSPHRNLKITQTLDTREQGNNNQINLEIKATSHGLTPDLDEMLAFPPKGFKIVNIDDRQLQIDTLDPKTSDLAPISTHEWKITLEAETEELPSTFTFPEPKLPLAKEEGLLLQRYEDVDLVTTDKTTSLTTAEHSSTKVWYYVLGALILAAIISLFVFNKSKPSEQQQQTQKILPPTDLTPVTLLSYLQKLQTDSNLSSEQSQKITQEIQTLQIQSFSNNSTPPTKGHLQKIVDTWRKAA